MIYRCLLLCCLLFAATRALAGAEEVPSRIVVMTAVGRGEPIQALQTRVLALLGTVPVVVEWTAREQFRPSDVLGSSSHPALARIWLDTRDRAQAVLYLVDDAHERYLVRVIPLEGGYDEIACESLGTIVASSVEALLAGATVGVSREAAREQVLALESNATEVSVAPSAAEPKTLTKVPAAPPPSSRFRFGVDAAYRAQLLSEEPIFRHGPELGILIRKSGAGFSPVAFASVGYSLPVRWENEEIGATFEGGLVRLGPGLRFGFGPKTSVTLQGLLGGDWSIVEPSATQGAASPRSTMNVFSPMLGFMVEAEMLLTQHFGTSIAVGAEGDLLGHHFDVLVGGKPEPVLTPWIVRPLVRLGVRVIP